MSVALVVWVGVWAISVVAWGECVCGWWFGLGCGVVWCVGGVG